MSIETTTNDFATVLSSYWEQRWDDQACHYPAQQRAFDYFKSSGWPTAKVESWQGTSVRMLQKEWNVGAKLDENLPTAILEQLPECDRVVVINGRVSIRDSSFATWRLRDQNPKDFPWRDGVEALAQAFSQSALTFEASLDSRPLVIVHFQSEEETFAPISLHVEIPAHSNAKVLECWCESAKAWTGGLTQVTLGHNAKLEWVRWQRAMSCQMSAQQFDLAEGAELNLLNVQTGGDWSRSRCEVNLRGENARAQVHGLTFGQNTNHMDQRLEVRHLAPKTWSRQLFKAVLRDRAKSIFAGRVIIPQLAQKSDSGQRHQSLCFHSTAEAITRPELEINADDVKASHGATVGRLDQDELFYLQTRGIGKQQATELLARAFVEDVIRHISERSFYEFIDTQLNLEISMFLKEMEKAI
jgi:Fe-S cluster assembly protein SufD